MEDSDLEMIKCISDTINDGPVRHAGGGNYDIFKMERYRDIPQELKNNSEYSNGIVFVPMDIWRDILLFSHWIEDSLLIRWAEFIRKINKAEDSSQYLAKIAKPIFPLRDTKFIRDVFGDSEVTCVWSGNKISKFDIDHVIPWSVWKNNDIWNLLPTGSKLNGKKSDYLPSPELIANKYNHIQEYWDFYHHKFGELFDRQLFLSLNITPKEIKGSSKGLDSLINTVQRIQIINSGEFWSYKG